MTDKQIISKHRINAQGDQYDDDGSSDRILNALAQRTNTALAFIKSAHFSILNTLRQSSNHRSLLHLCVGIDWYEAVVQLLQRSVDVNLIDTEQHTPLMLALNLSRTKIFKCLLAYENTNINYQTINDGFTVLHLAVINDRDQYLKILLQQTKHRMDRNLVTHSEKNFLHLMADFKSHKCLTMMRKFSFDDYLWTQKDYRGYTPLLIALIRWPYSSFTRHLLRFLLHLSSTSLHLQDNHGKTILHWAIFNHQLVKLIIQYQCRSLGNIKDNFGRIPLDYAYEQQLLKSVEYLRS